jgi:hypothetical protein
MLHGKSFFAAFLQEKKSIFPKLSPLKVPGNLKYKSKHLNCQNITPARFIYSGLSVTTHISPTCKENMTPDFNI